MQYLKDKKTNVVYSLYTFRSKSNQLHGNIEKLSILGNEYTITKDNEKDVNKKIENEIKNIVWFCYRKNFDPIVLNNNSGQLTTDSGWGCMIRVGQMMLYIFLNRLLNKEDNVDKRYGILSKYFKEHKQKELTKEDEEQIEEILGNFETMETNVKDVQFVDEKCIYKEKEDYDQCKEPELEEIADQLNDKESKDKYTLSQVVDDGRLGNLTSNPHKECKAKDQHKEDDFEPLQMNQRVGSLDYSTKLFIDDHDPENNEEIVSDDDKSHEQEHEIVNNNTDHTEGSNKQFNNGEDAIGNDEIDYTEKLSLENENSNLKPCTQDQETNISSTLEEKKTGGASKIQEISKNKEQLHADLNSQKKLKHDLFSLQNIVLKAQEYLDTVPGSWFRPTTFLMVIKKLIKYYFKEVRVVNVIENTIILERIYKNVYGSKDSLPETVPEVVTELSHRPWTNKLLLSISTMLGLEAMEPRYKHFLDILMGSKNFCGILGGRHQSAYFIVGNNDKGGYYYLDPHYVKETVTDFSDQKLLNREFFDKKLLEIDYSKLSTSVSLIFFLESCEDFREFWDILKYLEDYYKDDYFMSYMVKNDINDADYAEDDILTF